MQSRSSTVCLFYSPNCRYKLFLSWWSVSVQFVLRWLNPADGHISYLKTLVDSFGIPVVNQGPRVTVDGVQIFRLHFQVYVHVFLADVFRLLFTKLSVFDWSCCRKRGKQGVAMAGG